MNINMYNPDDLNDDWYDDMLNDMARELYPSPIIDKDVSIEDIDVKDNSRLYKLKDERIIKLINTPQNKITFFNDINWDDNSSELTIEKENDLYSYNLFLSSKNKCTKVWENKRDSLNNMFYSFDREIHINVPDTIIDLLYADGNKRELGYNLLKQYIKNN